MEINLKRIGQDILTAYIVVAIDVFGGFEANLNILNWNSSKVTKFIILFGIITLVNLMISRFKKKSNRN